MPDVFLLIGLSLFGSIIALVGGVFFLYNKSLSHKLEQVSVPFAAGVLITTALVGLLPEAIDLIGRSTFLIVLLTFLTAYLIERVFFDIHHHSTHEHKHDYRTAGWMVMAGDTIHNFVDGVAIGASFLIAPTLGIITAFSTFLHEVPHEIGDFGILLKAGWRRRNILLTNLLSASVALLGALLVFYIPLGSSIIGSLIAISAGLFLYLGAADFLPHITSEEKRSLKTILPLFIGVGIMLIVLFAIPHDHPEELHLNDQYSEEILQPPPEELKRQK